jgi:integrase
MQTNGTIPFVSPQPAGLSHLFGLQAQRWLADLVSQRRKPLSPASISAFTSYVRRLVPMIGADKSLADINSGTLRDLVTQLVAEELSAKTIGELVATVKQVVASAVDGNGDPVFPRQWNSKHIDAPSIGKQKQPSLMSEDVERCIKNATSEQERLLYAVLSGSGLRIAECLAIHVGNTDSQTSWNEDAATITVRSSIYRGQEQPRLKTQSANRTVDLDPRLNIHIDEFTAKHNREAGSFLFQNKRGGPMHLKTARNRLRKLGVKGFHSFRRFRTTRLRERNVPEDILRYWIGHAGQSISDRYSKLAENVELRKEWAGVEGAGLGFDIRLVGTPPPKPNSKAKSSSHAESTSASKTPARKDPKAEIVVKHSLVRRKPVLSVPDVVEAPTSPVYVASDEDLDPFFATPVTVHEEV